MAEQNEPDGKNSLLGEFLVSLARSPEHVQEAIILFGLDQMKPYGSVLIQPYPMMSHLEEILKREKK